MTSATLFDTIDALTGALCNIARAHSAVFVLCDEHTAQHCLPRMTSALPHIHIITIQSGELHKTLSTCAQIWSALTERHADRKALLVNLGGGVICDMGGFAASCYKRGISFVHIPTTLLAMVDASVGGKTGVDFDSYKNQVGLFSEAKEILICPDFLQTLDERQRRSGFAEVVKHYLIADARAFYMLGDQPGTPLPDRHLIEKAVMIKSQFIAADPYERNIRKALNYGHTIGHAVESHYLDTDAPLLHGEAIAIGMAVETIISNRLGLLPSDQSDRILRTLRHYFPLPQLPEADVMHIIALTAQDKKNSADKIRFVSLTGIGRYQIDVTVSTEMIAEAIADYNNLR